MVRDPYGVLGVSPGCSEDELKSAYRRLAKQYHPDLHPGDAAAAERMNEINAAYDQLKNGPAPGASPYGGASPFGGAAYGYAAQNGAQAEYDPFAAYRAWQEQAWQQSQQQRYTSYRVFRPGALLFRIFLIFILVRLLFSLLLGGLWNPILTQDGTDASPYSFYSQGDNAWNRSPYGYYYYYDAGQQS